MILLELARECGVNPKWAASTGGGEYHSACPNCGGKDRFFIQPNKMMSKCMGSYCCRQCGKHGDAIQFGIDFLNLTFKDSAERVGVDLSSNEYMFKQKNTALPSHIVAPSPLWIEKAGLFVNWAYQSILQQPDILKNLEQRGIPLEAVKQYKIGWCRQNFSRPAHEWGIQRENDKPIWISKGIVIPTIENDGAIIRVKIRRHDYKEGDKLPKYVAISGSMNGLGIIGDTNNEIMIVVESELDAYALHHIAGDFVFIIAVGSNIKNPDNVTNYYAKNVPILLICHDNDDAGKNMLNKWKCLYPQAKGFPTPIGKDVGDAIMLGFDIKKWLLDEQAVKS